MKYLTFLFFWLVFAFVGCLTRHDISSAKNDSKDNCNDFDTLIINGTYIGANLFFTNPYVNCLDTTICFATKAVKINDTISLNFDEINSSAFEIPLRSTGYKMNTKIKLELIYIGGNRPKLLHPEVH